MQKKKKFRNDTNINKEDKMSCTSILECENERTDEIPEKEFLKNGHKVS